MPASHTVPSDAIVVTDRLIIRAKRESDAADDYRWRCDPEIARYDALDSLTEPFEAFYISFEHERRYGRPGREAFSIDDVDGRHIGNIMYYNAGDAHESAEFGISISEEPRREVGLGTEAAVAFLDFLWRERPFRRIVLHTLGWNTRAIRCFERAGFTANARILRNGEWFIRMETQREWWLLWQSEGRFATATRDQSVPRP